MSDPERTAPEDIAIELRVSALEAVEIDAFAAEQADRPTRPEAVRRLVRQALGMRDKSDGEGLRPDELTAENDG